jgi:cardiolipin synthase
MICDDNKAIIGTINLDYRSLIHNFECAAYLYNDETILTMMEEYKDLLDDCDEIDLKNCKVKWYVSLLRKTLSFFSPVL